MAYDPLGVQAKAKGQAATSATGTVQSAIGAGAARGFFDPAGSPAIRAALQRRARRQAEKQRRRSSTIGQLVGLNPQAQQQNIIDTDRQSAGQTSDFLNEAQGSELMGNRDWVRQLLSGRLGQEDALTQMRLQAKMQGGGFGSQLGGLLGTGAGALLGGPAGAALGGQLGGALGGKKKPTYDPYAFSP